VATSLRLVSASAGFSYLASCGAVRSEFGEGGVTGRLRGLFFILFDPYFRLVTSAYYFGVLVRVDSKNWACQRKRRWCYVSTFNCIAIRNNVS